MKKEQGEKIKKFLKRGCLDRRSNRHNIKG